MIVTATAPVSSTFSCCATASSNVQPLAMLCASAPDRPAPSTSVHDAPKTAYGVRNLWISFPAVRVPSPGISLTKGKPVKLFFPTRRLYWHWGRRGFAAVPSESPKMILWARSPRILNPNETRRPTTSAGAARNWSTSASA